MAIIDLDELKNSKEPVGFKLLDKEHIVPEMSYALTLQLEEIRKKVQQSVKKDDYQATMDGSIQTILKVIPEMKESDLRENVSVGQLRRIVEIINTAFIGEEAKEGEEKELAFYREKYADEYRKKDSGTKVKKKKKS